MCEVSQPYRNFRGPLMNGIHLNIRFCNKVLCPKATRSLNMFRVWWACERVSAHQALLQRIVMAMPVKFIDPFLFLYFVHVLFCIWNVGQRCRIHSQYIHNSQENKRIHMCLCMWCECVWAWPAFCVGAVISWWSSWCSFVAAWISSSPQNEGIPTRAKHGIDTHICLLLFERQYQQTITFFCASFSVPS